MAIGTNGANGSPPRWLEFLKPFIGPIIGMLLALPGGVVTATWLTATDRAEMRNTLQQINKTLEQHAGRLEKLDQQDRELSSVPLRLEQAVERITRLEAIGEEARRADRATAAAIAEMRAEVRSLAGQVQAVGQDVRELRAERRGTIPPPPLPYRAGEPPAGFRPTN